MFTKALGDTIPKTASHVHNNFHRYVTSLIQMQLNAKVNIVECILYGYNKLKFEGHRVLNLQCVSN